ncbi:helicase-related protein [Haloplanus rubicundus]|uniref:Helicase n=1 Tax=Haloplanus rubicundus TaxID=1547898 RepID=A0A345E8A6_9EURY|nr:helicase-related protein [Haloplanus rubicundus]AXG08428.1 helicase [Haloplanus rubicundus]
MYEPGDRVRINDQPAEVIRTDSVGDIEYLRAYIEGVGAKTISVADVEIKPIGSQLDDLPENFEQFHPAHEAVDAERFDLRMEALNLTIAHEQGQLLSISNSLVRLEPYQLACVNQVMESLRQRALIADDVGLGKTIEAGLILKELQARNRADSVLFVVPAHLQKKWVRDMDRFFDIDLTVADRAWVEGERRRLGDAANIWDQDGVQLITSMAFLRQDEFQPALEEAFWDAVVIDEAHKAAQRGDSPSVTSQMAERVAHNSESLLLLSATPHDGKGQGFRSLISYLDPLLVAEDQELSRETVEQMMIRRGKQTIYDDNGERIFPNREVRTMTVSMTPAEEQLYEGVTTYVQEVYNRSEQLNEPAVGFAMALMQKRLVSSVGAIRETLRRRLQGLLEEGGANRELSEDAEAYLDGEDLEENDREAAEQELETLTVVNGDDALQTEIQMLQDLVNQAESIPVDTKAQQVKRYIQQLLEESPNEKLLLFTEYRDTLDYLLEEVSDQPWAEEILVIHGDVDKDDRQQIEDQFNHGEPRLLFATDAASEGIDLQHSCHIMVNYELPWNPNRLEQRIGRIHRYGQDKEVKVWNFQFEGTREGEIFELLQEKVENIRSQVGSTADVLGMLDDINIDDLIMRSVQSEEPPEATAAELEELMEEREQTLLEWYDRSLIDPSTFDAESRERIEAVIDESADVFGTEADIRAFVDRGLEAFGGRLEKRGNQLYDVFLPASLSETGAETQRGPVTFSREFAMDHQGIEYLSPDDSLVLGLREQLLAGDDGVVGLKLLPFIENPGITFVYRVGFEDGTGEMIQEELVPVFVDLETKSPRRPVGEQVLEAETIRASPDSGAVRELLVNRDELEAAAEEYVANVLGTVQSDISADRATEVEQERANLEAYAEAERERIQAFISEYQQQAAAGEDMEISIRGQRRRLDRLDERVDERKAELERRRQVISLAPEVEGYCLALPIQ